ncbi:dipeptide/oligopeptide/nickel ABC transporter permease/ATP-binding protein [Streptosporangium carneum]|uniref:Dipeptide/oligopeptide/nickel ABC transporter ATP-binding protein n=1 Tax=Streptosporangium carneum TaxID=47481 RepID=A0A9W6MDZ1_9ACTN|nr:dipeptide/oligopeptide/nickel ABC transporter permease/ATP-binding protein [Streptosporangium carneum]GLK10587.1 dipeptide/oligopeptide/nickel ABC transporter ATP-binding protein [Streptosporangium carneum]
MTTTKTRPALARRLLRRPSAVIAVAWLVTLTAASLGAPLIAAHGPLDQDLTQVLALPSAAHPLGTDSLGRDLLSRLLYGGQPALLAVAEALAVHLVVGAGLGLVAGYLGGWVDHLTTRIGDLLFALPAIVIVLVVLSVFPGNLHAAMVTFGVLGSPSMIRVLRSRTLGIRQEMYVAAARVSGLSDAQILRRHVLPRLTSTVIVQAALFSGVAVIIQAGLGFLGLGAQPPAPSWGGLVADASQVIDRDPWMLVPAGVPLVLTVIALMALGDAIRDTAVENWSVSKLAASGPVAPPPVAEEMAEETAGTSRAPDPDALLSVRDLTVEIGGVPVVQGVSFDVMPGETLGVVGESGCGKSVTALGVLGLVPGGGRVVRGRVVFDGVDLVGSPEGLARVRGSGIAYVSQDPMVGLDPTFTVMAQLAEAVRRHLGTTREQARERVLELLAMVGVPDPPSVARRHPHQLSGGLAQRVLIALALAGRPRLLIADEPTTALDVSVQKEILTLLHTLQRRTGIAVLIVTHDWGVVATLCHRSLVMYAGQVVEQADVEPMFVRPLHPYTAGLLAANPHQAVSGHPLVTIPGAVPPPRDWPVGCRFAARCPHAADDCRAAPVALVQPEQARLTRCLHFEELVDEGVRR